MRNKLILGAVVGTLVLALGGTAFGAGIVLKIAKNDLGNKTGGGMDPTYNGPGSVDTANIEFFKGNPPTDPTSPTGRINDFGYTELPDVHQYKNTGVNGGSVTIRSWDGPPRTKGSNYGISPGYTAASGASPALQYTVPRFQAGYLADAPINAPNITSVSESNQRIEDTSNVILSLTINFSYDSGSFPNKIIASGYDVKYWFSPEGEPADSDADRVASTTGGSWSLPATDPKTQDKFGGGTYYFRVRAKNVFGPGPWSDPPLPWLTLSGGDLIQDSIPLTLKKMTEGFGVNSIAIPFTSVYDQEGNPIESLADLVTLLNAAGEGHVATIGYWDKESQQEVGFILNEAGEVQDKINTEQDMENIPLARGQGYQISVTEDKSVTIRNYQ